MADALRKKKVRKIKIAHQKMSGSKPREIQVIQIRGHLLVMSVQMKTVA